MNKVAPTTTTTRHESKPRAAHNDEPLWVENVWILFDKFWMLWPSTDLSTNQRYNALTRLLIVYCMIIAWYRKSMYPLHVMCMVLVLIGVLETVSEGRGRGTYTPGKCSKKMSGSPRVSYMSSSCRKPTSTNPYMNTLVGQSADDACSNVPNTTMDKLMTQNLPVDDWDIMGKANSQRQFYTVPCQAGTCDSTSFANFLYNNPYR